MRTLVLDLGNSTLFGGVFADDRLVRQFRLTAPLPAGWAGALRARLRGRIDHVAFCSVVPARTKSVASAVHRAFGVEPQVLSATANHGLHLAYRRPAELGADRVANVLGAQKLCPGRNVIVVDCGTATTLTLLGRNGRLLGGAILPGLGLWSAMLAQRTARLPAIVLRASPKFVGRSTQDALRSGIVRGHAGAIRELLRGSRREAFGRAPVTVIGTGGWVTHLNDQRLFTRIEPGLILHGLHEFSHRLSCHA
ncbi:MAG: type III pantothenate kinase [Opitutales bacterium]